MSIRCWSRRAKRAAKFCHIIGRSPSGTQCIAENWFSLAAEWVWIEDGQDFYNGMVSLGGAVPNREVRDHEAGYPPVLRPDRRQLLALLGGAAVLAGESVYLAAGDSPDKAGQPGGPAPDAYSPGARYAPDGTAGERAALPMGYVRLSPGSFSSNALRNLNYLLFLDPDRMLRSFRLNYGLPATALPLGGWEQPTSRIRGHITGHLLSSLALAYASTGTTASDPTRRALRARGDYLVAQLAALQRRATVVGYHSGYLSGFPEVYFDWLEQGRFNRIWSPYYMIHKYLAGLIDQYQLAGNAQALDVATRLADWVDRRTAKLTYQHMQAILEVEFGGLPEALANLYRITGEARYLRCAERFYHARFLDPLANGVDNLAGEQCNISTPKVIGTLRLAEETGRERYWNAAVNFWNIAVGHHSYAIGGQGDHEHWGPPGVVAAELSNYTCEGCVSYNMLKLTRLLAFHAVGNASYSEYYERTLFNHLLGTQDPSSPHGLVCYYMGLSPGAHKQQPLNYFSGSTAIYATDYDTFTCDTGTGLETPTRFGTAIYSRDADGLRVNLFVASVVRVPGFGLTFRQVTGLPDVGSTALTVVAGAGRMTLRVRVPGWAAGRPRVTLNGKPVSLTNPAPVAGSPAALVADAGPSAGSDSGDWISLTRRWQAGDELAVTFGVELRLVPAPDDPSVAAVSYGPVVLAGLTGTDTGPANRMPVLDVASVRRVGSGPLAFEARATFPGLGSRPVELIPVSRVAHQDYTVYWRLAAAQHHLFA
jgi:DUF1680 family protein